MATSYYVLGDWLPALRINAFMVSSQANEISSKISIPLLAVVSYPFELAISIAGLVLFLRLDKRKSFRLYLIVMAATLLLFAAVFKGKLPSYGGVARYLLPFIALLLPYGGFFLTRLLRMPQLGRNQGVVAGWLILLIIGTFDILRAFNYPDSFPKDAIHAGWTLRGLQETGTIPANGRILIERGEDWGDVAIVALANRPERFVLLNELAYQQAALSGHFSNRPVPVALSGNEGVRGDVCEKGFKIEACKMSLRREKFDLVILSSPERVQSFQDTFHRPSWTIGRYHIFDMTSLLPSGNLSQGRARTNEISVH